MQQTSETSRARPASADHARRSAAPGGALARLTTVSLTAAGLQITGPDPTDADGCRLLIASRAAQCELTISDSADAELTWTPFAAKAADPHRVADLAAALLSGRAGARHPRAGNSGAVYVTDDGGLTWQRDYWEEHAATEREPGFRSWLPDPSAVARSIADDVSRALCVGHDAPAAC